MVNTKSTHIILNSSKTTPRSSNGRVNLYGLYSILLWQTDGDPTASTLTTQAPPQISDL
jgi:hypothetical protein